MRWLQASGYFLLTRIMQCYIVLGQQGSSTKDSSNRQTRCQEIWTSKEVKKMKQNIHISMSDEHRRRCFIRKRRKNPAATTPQMKNMTNALILLGERGCTAAHRKIYVHQQLQLGDVQTIRLLPHTTHVYAKSVLHNLTWRNSCATELIWQDLL